MRFLFKQKTAYEMRISDWSSDVCSSDLLVHGRVLRILGAHNGAEHQRMEGARIDALSRQLVRNRFVESKEDAVAADLLHCFDYGGGLARPCNRFNNGVACARFNESKDGSLEAAPAGCGVHLVDRKSTRLNSSH